MRVLADENVPRSVVQLLRDGGNDVVWVAEEAPGLTDADVLAMANSTERVLLTFDKDFGELAFRTGMSAASGVILVRAREGTPDDIAALVARSLSSQSDWTRTWAVIDSRKIRLRTLPPNPS